MTPQEQEIISNVFQQAEVIAQAQLAATIQESEAIANGTA